MADVESLELQITSDAKGAKDALDALIDTLDTLKTKTSGFSASTNKIQQFLNSSSKVPSSNKSSSKSFASLAASITATVYAFKRGASVVSSWINKSNEYVENQNLFAVAMGEYADEAQKYAEQVGEVMGIDPSAWMRSQGVFMTLGTGFGVTTDRAAVMSQQLTQLGYDLSSFFNISVEEAMQKLQSGFSGELEPLRNLGYDLSQAKLESIALSLGIDKSVSSMTQAEKAQLRYYAIMTQVTTAQGDMARTLEAPANQLRIFQAQTEQAARALGNIFIPALNALLPYAIAAVKVVRLLANAIANLVGFSMPEVDFSDAGSGSAQISENLEEATGKAAKLKKTLLGIDELNVMSDPSSGSGSGSDSGGGFDFEIPTYDFIGEATNNRVNEIVEKMKEWLGLTGEINSWSDLFDTNLGQILLLVGEIGAGFALWKLSTGLLDGIKALKELKNVGLDTPLTILAGATLSITGFTIEFTALADAIKNGLDGLNFGEILVGGLLGTGGAAILGSGLATWIDTAFAGSAIDLAITQAGINLGVGTAGAAGAAILGSVAAIIAGIPAFFVGIYDAIKNGLDWLNALLIPAGSTAAAAGIGAIIGMLGGPIGAGIGALIGLAVGLVTDLVILIVQNWESITAWCSDACAAIGQFFSDLWGDIVSVWNVVASWFDANVIQPVVSFFTSLWTSISNAASDCWDAIVDFFSPAINWFSQLFGSIWQTISDIFYNIGVIASGCWQIIVAVWGIVSQWFNTNVVQPVGTFFTNLWNGIKSVATAAWNGIKSVYTAVATWFNTTIIQPVSTFFTNLWSGFLNGAKQAWEGVKSVFNTVATFFKTTFQNAWAGVVKVFSVAGEIFTNIKNGIVTAFKSVVNGLIKGINNVISVPFNAINTALTTLKNIKILGLTPFSNIRTISVPSIPLLAQGGIVDAGQLFVARERGPELVANAGGRSAVMNNDQIVESVSQGVYQAVVAAMGQSGGNQVVEAKVNDKVLFEVVLNRNRQETMRKGYNPLLGGV